jgi:hypothetical protein
MSRIMRSLGWLMILAVVGVAAVSLPAAGESATPTTFRPAIKVSRETTFITEPLRKDGTVDYLAALNRRQAQGVTPQDNAAVLLLQAMGPGEINEKTRERFFQMLGTPRLADKGPYLESFVTYFNRKYPDTRVPNGREEWDATEIAEKQYQRIMERPWSKKEFPIAASWLEDNWKQIDLIAEATKRPRYYAPLLTVGEPEMLIVAQVPVAQQSREAARDLTARAMFRIASGKVEDAWQDLLACHRLGRLVSQGPTLVELVVGIAIEGIAIDGDAVLTHVGKLTAEQAQRFAAEFRRLPPMGKVVDRINWGERCTYLDCVTAVARKGPAEIARLDGGNRRKETWDWLTKRLANLFVDWNEAMRMGNQLYDRLVAVLSKPTGRERRTARAEFERDLKKFAAGAKDFRVLLGNISSAGSLRGGLGRQLGHIFVALLMPAVSTCIVVEDRNAITESMVPVVFALGAYRTDHKGYPAELAALVPKYLPAIPEDPFSGGPVRYKRDGAGYVVYSVGLNGKDDGGFALWEASDPAAPPDCDDYPIHVPPKEK